MMLKLQEFPTAAVTFKPSMCVSNISTAITVGTALTIVNGVTSITVWFTLAPKHTRLHSYKKIDSGFYIVTKDTILFIFTAGLYTIVWL